MGLTQPKRCVLYQDLISTYQRSSVPILVLSCRNEHSGHFVVAKTAGNFWVVNHFASKCRSNAHSNISAFEHAFKLTNYFRMHIRIRPRAYVNVKYVGLGPYFSDVLNLPSTISQAATKQETFKWQSSRRRCDWCRHLQVGPTVTQTSHTAL